MQLRFVYNCIIRRYKLINKLTKTTDEKQSNLFINYKKNSVLLNKTLKINVSLLNEFCDKSIGGLKYFFKFISFNKFLNSAIRLIRLIVIFLIISRGLYETKISINCRR